jgi:peptide/nickel transport system substrate-binding protein
VAIPGPRKEPYQFISSILPGRTSSEIIIRLSENGRKIPEKTILLRLSLPASSIQAETGPYELIQWKKGNSLVLKKRPSNNEQLPEYIHIRIIPQSTSGLFLFSKNKLDAMKLSDFLLTHPIAQKNSIIQKKGRSVQYVAINNTNPCYDINFRKAVNLAIDRKAIIQKILDSQAEFTIASIPVSRLGTEVRKDLLPSYNLKIARSYLSKSKCFPEILEKTLEFRMRGDDENQSKGRAVAENLKKLGLSIKIKGMEKAPLYRENGEKKGDLTFLTWYADYESPLAFIDPVFHSEKLGNGGNRSFYSNPAMDKAIQENNIEDAIQILIQDKPWIFLWSIQENYLISNEIKKYPSLLGYL